MAIHLPVMPASLSKKRVLLRVDFNVPILNGVVHDDLRIKKTLPTIRELLSKKNTVILLSHMEREDGSIPTLMPVARYLRSHGFKSLHFFRRGFGVGLKDALKSTPLGSLILFENLRADPGEKNNFLAFARHLSLLGDIFINEAFSASHRAHASIVGIPKFLPSFAGNLFQKEVRELSQAFYPPRPFLLVVGGRKPIKFELVSRFLDKADMVVVGGAVLNTLLQARGIAIGKSVIDHGLEKKTLERVLHSRKVFSPSDVVVKTAHGKKSVSIKNINTNDAIYDMGPKTLIAVASMVKKSRFVLWNGPLGFVEKKGFDKGTKEFLRLLFSGKRKTIVGGGDTVAFLNKERALSKFSFVSTGGGAMLEFLAQGTLPGIEALKLKRVSL